MRDVMIPTNLMNEEYEWVKSCASRAGVEAESAAYLNAVRHWRQTWRPNRVTVLLVAESHVAEHPGDNETRVQTDHLPANVSDRFVRLVYCLGYGESWLCDPTPQKNGGTWQFWDLFGALVGGLDNKMPRVRRRPERPSRLAWKLATLDELKARGIWLVDASIVAFYAPGGRRPFRGPAYRDMLRYSFRRFVWPEVADEPLKQVWTIGRGVGEALEGIEGIDTSRIVSQPQDRDGARYFTDLERMVKCVQGV